jgi:hypothetical protein
MFRFDIFIKAIAEILNSLNDTMRKETEISRLKQFIYLVFFKVS